MFGKCVLVILAVGVTGCALLALRQSRLQAASEMVRIQLDIRNQDEELWLLRTQIAQQITPEQVRLMMSDVGPLKPINTAANSTDATPPDVAATPTPSVKPSGSKPDPTTPATKAKSPAKSAPAGKPSEPRKPSASNFDRRFAAEKDRPKDQQ